MKAILTSDTHYGFSRRTHSIHEKFWQQVALEKPDVLIHAGDIASHRQDQFERSLRMMRVALPITPIVIVRGNHDLWEVDRYDRLKLGNSWSALYTQQREWMKELGIQHASEGIELDGVLITGFDGWYKHPNPPTNDRDRMLSEFREGEDVFQWLSRQAHEQLAELLDLGLRNYRKTICVTHMPPFTDDWTYLDHCANPEYYPLLTKKFDVLCVGHSHRRVDRMEGRCRVLNAGSDYDKPAFLSFDI